MLQCSKATKISPAPLMPQPYGSRLTIDHMALDAWGLRRQLRRRDRIPRGAIRDTEHLGAELWVIVNRGIARSHGLSTNDRGQLTLREQYIELLFYHLQTLRKCQGIIELS